MSEAEQILQENAPGSFLVRPSHSKSDAYVLSVRYERSKNNIQIKN